MVLISSWDLSAGARSCLFRFFALKVSDTSPVLPNRAAVAVAIMVLFYLKSIRYIGVGVNDEGSSDGMRTLPATGGSEQ